MKHIIRILLLAVMIASILPNVSQANPSTLNKYRNSIVRVEVRTMTEPLGGFNVYSVSTGTGFFIDNETVITNYHVVGDSPESVTIYRKLTRLDLYNSMDVVYRDEINDIAILKFRYKNREPGDPLSFSPPVDHDPISVIGFPNNWYTYEKGKIELGEDLNPIHVKVDHGSSGSPVLNSDGKVVGIVVARSVLYPKIGYSIDYESIIKAIEEYRGEVSK